VLEGGRTADAGPCCTAPARLPFPDAWRCVVAVPRGKPGLAGDDEAAAFARLPSPNAGDVERVSHLVLMQLFPRSPRPTCGVRGRAGRSPAITGGWFAPAQGGVFAARRGGRVGRAAAGVGCGRRGAELVGTRRVTASWVILARPRRWRKRVRAAVGPGGFVYEGGFSVAARACGREGGAASRRKGGSFPGD